MSLVGDPRAAAYAAYNLSLAALREEFHRTGRFDDANTKLDEIVKLLVISIHEARRSTEGQTDRFSEEYLQSWAQEQLSDRTRIAAALRELSREVLSDACYRNPDGTSIFGTSPVLEIQPSEDAFARKCVQLVRQITPHFASGTNNLIEEFDILNESFGHFVRDTFRQTKEDAQYMTPPEVVSAMCDIAFADIAEDSEAISRILTPEPSQPFVILDPTCGVGSFLVQALRRMLDLAQQRGTSSSELAQLAEYYRNSCIFGQDKVDRMVRLSRVNLMLFGGGAGSIFQGNSILGPSSLDELRGQVDLILTNPPFGAEYTVDEVLEHNGPECYPMLWDLRSKGRLPKKLDSELLLLDRCLSLLRPGGRLLIVLPDKVISAKGIEATARKWIGERARIKAIVELPAVTFAQAGTRTKTCFVYLQRPLVGDHRDSSSRVYMAVCEQIGFEVVERVGVPLKVPSGTNQLPDISREYRESQRATNLMAAPFEVVSEDPSAVWVRRDALINGRWTPGFFHVRRLSALRKLNALRSAGLALRPLSSLAKLSSRHRRPATAEPGAKTISVLHVSGDGTIDLQAVASYEPKTPGRICKPGEVLFSKINPRIPRICVVPEIGHPLACSPEFEILRPRPGVDPYLLVACLRTPLVQEQVRYLTSGTSSSHNRIKDTELAEILLPWPEAGSTLERYMVDIARTIERAVQKRYEADAELDRGYRRLNQLLAPDE